MDLRSQSVLRPHCRRVASVALEVGRSLGIPGHLESVLEQAALLHHSFDFGSGALARLATEVCAAEAPAPAPAPAAPPLAGSAEVGAVLAILNRPGARHPDASLQQLAAIVRMCGAMDDQIEAMPFEHKALDAILDELREIAVFEGFDPAMVDRLRRFRCQAGNWRPSSKLPVEARIAQEVFRRFAPNRDYEVRELEEIAARDPVLSGMLIQVANSARYNLQSRVSTVGKAIAYVGTSTARDVVLAAAIRPLFASAGLLRLWSHSVHLAQLCSALAEQTEILEPQSAMLLGLVHDIGALAVQMLPGSEADRYQRLVGKGCPATYVENLMFGRDHGEIGSEILSEWKFPEQLIEAVRFHHQPERSESRAVALLFLAEFWSGMDEDIPSARRIEECSRRTGISIDSLIEVHVPKSALSMLRSVA